MKTDLPRGLSHAVSAKSVSPNPEKLNKSFLDTILIQHPLKGTVSVI